MSFSPEDRDRELCRNIVEAFGHIQRYIEGFSQKDFLIDSKTQDAVAMRLQQTLESASKLSPGSRAKLNINWSALTAMRNKISHSYVDIDAEIVWEVINDLEEFQQLVSWAKTNI
jgi:uncharacterized protein with HEPN domain